MSESHSEISTRVPFVLPQATPAHPDVCLRLARFLLRSPLRRRRDEDTHPKAHAVALLRHAAPTLPAAALLLGLCLWRGEGGEKQGC